MRRILVLPLLVLAGACIQKGFPLSSSGSVDVSVDVSGPLYAAGALDMDGNPVTPRQSPYETGVTLYMTENGQPAYGAYVDVRVSPPDALTLESDPKEKSPTCTANGGAFRCMATSAGYARFVATSAGVWSGTAKLQIDWGGNQPKEQPVTILPAGLPQDATDFQMVVGGVGGSDHVLATYTSLQCTSGPVPDDLGSKWPAGKIRARQAYVIATAPPASPTVLTNAPVVVESHSAEAAIALKPDCVDRHPRLRMLMNASGQTDPFYLCFSDDGGNITFAVNSGQKVIDPPPQITVEPEPRLLRVRAVVDQVYVSTLPLDVFEVSAYNSDRQRIAIDVDVHVDDPTVLSISQASVTLADESSPASVVQGLPLMPGTVSLHASPRLLDMPDCASPPVTVTNPPTGP
jgi:hypothetical protein